MMIQVSTSGSLDYTLNWLDRIRSAQIYAALDRYGRMGVEALSKNTPVASGKTARSWTYRVGKEGGKWVIEWSNTNTINGANIAILLQYGHGTGTGGYVAGYDYINPAIQPLMNKISEEVWKEVTR